MSNKIKTKLSRCNVKLVFNTPEFFVNESKRAVACKVRFDVRTPKGNYTDGQLFNFAELADDLFCVCMDVVGIAHCSENDVWDVNVGCKIAKARAEEKAYRLVLGSVRKSVKELEELVTVGKDFIAAAEKYCKHNEDYIDKISMNVDEVHAE